ncbi:MAG: SRPBCC family protein [Planctomycetes bacterium]|nr:SRPBCC family protein [Planctomycetota bacterium]
MQLLLSWIVVILALAGAHLAADRFALDWLLYVALALDVLAGIALLITLLGLLCRRTHQVSRTVTLNQSADAVFAAISDIAGVPAWNKMVLKAEKLPDRNGHELWRETYTGNYPVLLETTESSPPNRLVRTIADENGPFTGRWEFAIAPQEPGVQLTITEFGAVPNPFFRFMARMFMDPHQYIDLYLKALAGKFNETAAITLPAKS